MPGLWPRGLEVGLTHRTLYNSKTLCFNLAVDVKELHLVAREQSEDEDSDMEETEVEDSDSDRVTTPELVRALSDLVPHGAEPESLNLVLESSNEEYFETTMGEEEQQQPKKEEKQQQPRKYEEQQQQTEQGQMEEEYKGDDFYKIRMFGEEHEMDDSFVPSSSSSDSSISE